MLTGVTQILDVLHRRHVEAALRRFDATVPSDATSAEVVEVAVGFADLVGFSSLAERLDLDTFADAVADFGGIVSDTVVTGGGRVVKLIGDEVMFAASDATAGAEIALDLLDALATHPVLPPLRAALVAGRVVSCDGDYFGSVVNLAARLVQLAEPNALLVGESVARALPRDGFRVEFCPPQLVRDVARPVTTARAQRATI
jgi:adenylate cyclase